MNRLHKSKYQISQRQEQYYISQLSLLPSDTSQPYHQKEQNHNEWVVGGFVMLLGGGCTYRLRTALRPLKAPSVMWLMELWPRRRVWRSPSTARLPSSRRVKLLYDRFLERETEHETDREGDRGRQGDGERGGEENRGEKRENVLCEVWKEMTGWQNAEAARDIIILKFHG